MKAVMLHVKKWTKTLKIRRYYQKQHLKAFMVLQAKNKIHIG